MRESWTASVPLPGGDFDRFDDFLNSVEARWPLLPRETALRLARAYGTRIGKILGDAASTEAMGEDLGGGLCTREVDYLVAHEWARTTQDILWRRSKLQLHAPPETARRLDDYLNRTIPPKASR